ncbi:hypothetical protein II906_05550, partial [bacterium]|nr:hypothetical protein [bacterium]
MKINVSQIPEVSYKINSKRNYNKAVQITGDCFCPSFGRNSNNLLDSLVHFCKFITSTDYKKETKAISNEPASAFHNQLSEGIKKVFERNVPAQNLKNVMTPAEIREALPKLKRANFENSRENIENGIYCAELDYPSNYSDGEECATEILDRIAPIADAYKEKTGNDFMFAIADRDNIGGIQHTIRVLGENPEKYKNIKLIPAVKLTFAHEAPKSRLTYENSEVIAYGINPFSDNLINFTDHIILKRREMMLGFIKDIYKLYPDFGYNITQFAEQNELKYFKDYGISNLYWRAREYAERTGDMQL